MKERGEREEYGSKGRDIVRLDLGVIDGEEDEAAALVEAYVLDVVPWFNGDEVLARPLLPHLHPINK